MNLRQMEVFRAVMQEGGVTAAAMALGVSQPSVSEILRHTEDRLGLRLFERSKGRLRPTAEARRLFREVERVFEGVDRVHRTAEALRDADLGGLRIVSITALGLALAPALLGAFTAASPCVESRLVVMRRHEMTEALLNEQFDLGLTFLMGQDSRLLRRELRRDGLRVLLHAGHPLAGRDRLTLQELAGQPLIGFTPLQAMSVLARRLFAEAGLSYHAVSEVEHIVQAWTMVQAGAGVSIVDPFSALGTLFPAVRAVPLASPASLSLEAVMPRTRPIPVAAQSFLRQAATLLNEGAEAGACPAFQSLP